MASSHPPARGDDWIALISDSLPLSAAAEWVVLPSCGAVVTFSGTARDHAEGRDGVTRLEYEAYDTHVVPRLREIAAEARRRWPDLGRFVLLHRVGLVPIGESSVFVAASAPHRDAAFEAARFGIDTVKRTAPIWKRETWAGGESWGLAAQPVSSVGRPDDVPQLVGGSSVGVSSPATAKLDGPAGSQGSGGPDGPGVLSVPVHGSDDESHERVSS